jgi:hypothetical protein
MKNALQNQDCHLEAGTKECLRMTWPEKEYGCNTPCQHCDWWDAYCDGEDDNPVTIVYTGKSFYELLKEMQLVD